MNDINKIRIFNQYKKEFETGVYNLNTVERLVNDIRFKLTSLTEEEFRLLIQIPISVLEMDVDISSEDIKSWQNDNSNYFFGNVEGFDDDFFKELKNRFLEKNFYIDDIINLAKYYEKNFRNLIKEFNTSAEIPLRIVEVTLRDVKQINENNFLSSSNIFSKIIEKAIDFN